MVDYLSRKSIHVKPFHEKLYICEKFHKHIYQNEILCHAVNNKMALDPTPDEIKDFKKFEKVLVSKRILFKKKAIMQGKGDFSKIKRNICNVPTETLNICDILPRPAVSSVSR